jgi:hypothetical protein
MPSWNRTHSIIPVPSYSEATAVGDIIEPLHRQPDGRSAEQKANLPPQRHPGGVLFSSGILFPKFTPAFFSCPNLLILHAAPIITAAAMAIRSSFREMFRR